MEKLYQFNFEKLKVWHLAKELVNLIYDIAEKYPEREKYNLESQIKRATVSVMNNLAEGSARSSYRDQARFTEISYASLMEVINCAIISEERKFISKEEVKLIREKGALLGSKLINYRKSQLSKISS